MLLNVLCAYFLQVDLSGGVDFTGSQVLGSTHPLSNIVKEEENELFVQSDCDEQLIITIRFQSTVKVNSFKIFAPDNGIYITLNIHIFYTIKSQSSSIHMQS